MAESTHAIGARGIKRRNEDVISFSSASFKAARFVSYDGVVVAKESIPAKFVVVVGSTTRVDIAGFTSNDEMCALDSAARTCRFTEKGVAWIRSGHSLARGIYTLPRDLVDPPILVNSRDDMALRAPPKVPRPVAVVSRGVVSDTIDDLDEAILNHRKILRRIPPFAALLVASTLSISPDCIWYDLMRFAEDSIADTIGAIPVDFWPALFTLGIVRIFFCRDLADHTLHSFLSRYIVDLSVVAFDYHPISLLDAIFAAYEPYVVDTTPRSIKLHPDYNTICTFVLLANLRFKLPAHLIRCVLQSVRAPMPVRKVDCRKRCRQFTVVTPPELDRVLAGLPDLVRSYILHYKPVGACEYLIICKFSTHIPLRLLLTTQHFDFMWFGGVCYFWLTPVVPHLVAFLRLPHFANHLALRFHAMRATAEMQPERLRDGLLSFFAPSDIFSAQRCRSVAQTVAKHFFSGHVGDTSAAFDVLRVCRAILAQNCNVNVTNAEPKLMDSKSMSTMNFPRNRVCLAHDCYFKSPKAPRHTSINPSIYLHILHSECSKPKIDVTIRSYSHKHGGGSSDYGDRIVGVITLIRNIAHRRWQYRLSLTRQFMSLRVIKEASIAMS